MPTPVCVRALASPNLTAAVAVWWTAYFSLAVDLDPGEKPTQISVAWLGC